MDMENIIYRVYDKKNRFHQSYSPKLQDGKSWAIDCASLIKGSVKEDCLDELGIVKSSKVIFNAENK
jgi:hypothetical protein